MKKQICSITIRISKKLRARLEAKALECDETVTAITREAIVLGISKVTASYNRRST